MYKIRQKKKKLIEPNHSTLLSQSISKQLSSIQDSFGSFIYKDHVTRLKWTIAKLTPSYSNQQSQTKHTNSIIPTPSISFDQNMLSNLKQMRNQWLVKQTKLLQNKNTQSTYNKFNEIKLFELQRKNLEKEVQKLNKELLRKYLAKKIIYQRQYGELNELIKSNSLTKENIIEIKTKIDIIRKEINQQNKKKKKEFKQSIQTEKQKLKYMRQFDTQFDNIWKYFQKDIIRKVRSQGLFNLRNQK